MTPASHPALAPAEERITHSVDVPLSPKDAFDLFTAEFDLWWPKARHSIAEGKLEFERRKGGRLTERLSDGTRAVWARIATWIPNRRIGLVWNDDIAPGEVDITFTAIADGTRVTVVHSPNTAPETAPRQAANLLRLASRTSAWVSALPQGFAPFAQQHSQTRATQPLLWA